MEDFVDQLKEQVSVLSVYLQEERNRHEEKESRLMYEHDQDIADLEKRHQDDILALEKKHEEYVSLLKRHHKSTVSLVEKTLQGRITRLRNEYALLQAALRNYKDLVRSDFGKIWAEKEGSMRLASEEKATEMVWKVKLKMERQHEMDREELVEKYEKEMDQRVKYAVDRALSAMAAETDQSQIVHLNSDNVISEKTGTNCPEIPGNITGTDVVDKSCFEVPENFSTNSAKEATNSPGRFSVENGEATEANYLEVQKKSTNDHVKKDQKKFFEGSGNLANSVDTLADALKNEALPSQIVGNEDTSSEGSTVFSQTLSTIVRPSAAASFSAETLSHFPESPNPEDDVFFGDSDLISSDAVSSSIDADRELYLNQLVLEDVSDDEVAECEEKSQV